MKLEIKRHWFSEKTTTGVLILDRTTFCFTLEDVARAEGVKIPGKTAIPAGEYRVIIDLSARFGREMPKLLEVPNFEGIRIHAGNTDKDTEGCILVGFNRGPDGIWDSREAFKALFDQLKAAYDKQETICAVITNEQL
jgi:hypothetical protein